MKANHYVDNVRFYKELKAYKAAYNKAKKAKADPPKISNYIGQCFYAIATRIMGSACFSGYTYKDEMAADGMETCARYIHDFNPRKTKNPFAYFSQICYFAAIRRIKTEKKQSTIRSELIDNLHLSDIIANMESDDVVGDDRQHIQNLVKFLQENSDAVKKENARSENQTKIKRGLKRKPKPKEAV